MMCLEPLSNDLMVLQQHRFMVSGSFFPLMPTPQAHCGVTPSSFAGSETLAVMVLKLVHDFPQVLGVFAPIRSITAGGGD